MGRSEHWGTGESTSPALQGTGAHQPVCAAWCGKQQRPPAASLCSHQSHHLSCDCHKPQARTVQPQPVGPAQGSSPHSHPCRRHRRGQPGTPLRATGAGCPRNSPERVVALHHEAAEGSVVPTAQGGCCLGCAPDLTHHVPCPAEALLAHQLSASWGGTGVSSPTSHS